MDKPFELPQETPITASYRANYRGAQLKYLEAEPVLPDEIEYEDIQEEVIEYNENDDFDFDNIDFEERFEE